MKLPLSPPVIALTDGIEVLAPITDLTEGIEVLNVLEVSKFLQSIGMTPLGVSNFFYQFCNRGKIRECKELGRVH